MIGMNSVGNWKWNGEENVGGRGVGVSRTNPCGNASNGNNDK